MIAIKGIEMPNACTSTQETLGDIGVANCPLYNVCKYKDTIRTNYKPSDCPLVEITTCKECEHYYPDEDGRGYHCERDSNIRFSVHRDFYCAGAKRRNKNG